MVSNVQTTLTANSIPAPAPASSRYQTSIPAGTTVTTMTVSVPAR